MLVFCFSALAVAQQSSRALLERFSAAFNAQDAPAMLECVSDSVKWFGIAGDSVSVEVSGKSDLERWLKGYFKSCPSCRSEFLSLQQVGRFVSIDERASWKGKNGDRFQRSLAVYEIAENRILRVWYYPAE